MASELKLSFEFDRYVNGTLMAEGVTIERASTLDKAMVAAARIAPKGPNGETPVLVYRPAPAATDTGLVTVGEVSTVRESVAAFAGHMLSCKLKPGDLLCLRSQAVELLAAKDKTIALAETTMIEMHQDLNKIEAELAAERAEKEELRRAIMGKEPAPDLQHGNFLEMAATLHRACDGARKRAEYAEQRLGQSEAELKQARADNAAKDARIKELDRCHEGTIDLCNQKTAQIEALEAKLAAAEKALEPLADIADLIDAETEGMAETDELVLHFHDYEFAKWPVSLFRKARAVLGGKPS